MSYVIIMSYRAPMDTSRWLNGLPCRNKVYTIQYNFGLYTLMKVNSRTFKDFQASMYKKLRNKSMKSVRNADIKRNVKLFSLEIS